MNVIADWIKHRIQQNKNAIIMINGATGSGKSWSALSLGIETAEKLNTPFTVADNVAFTFTDMLRKTQLPQNQEAGTVFVFEEVGATGGGAASRDWQSKANRFFFSWAQTIRHRNQVLIFTTPMFTFLDAGTRTLVHMMLIMSGINRQAKVGYASPYVLQTNPKTGKLYTKRLRFKNSDGKWIRLDRQSFKQPSDNMIVAYEKVKTQYTTDLVQSIIDEEDKQKEKERKKDHNIAIKEYNLRKTEELVAKGLTIKEIAKELGKSSRTIDNYVKQLGGREAILQET